MCVCMLYQRLERLFALDAATVRINVGPYDEKSDLAVFMRDDLRLTQAIRKYVRRFDDPFGLLKLTAYDLDAKGVNIRLAHQFTFTHSIDFTCGIP